MPSPSLPKTTLASPSHGISPLSPHRGFWTSWGHLFSFVGRGRRGFGFHRSSLVMASSLLTSKKTRCLLMEGLSAKAEKDK
ncbi:unnamed protein product, partial [Ilex paraguariensis]